MNVERFSCLIANHTRELDTRGIWILSQSVFFVFLFFFGWECGFLFKRWASTFPFLDKVAFCIN